MASATFSKQQTAPRVTHIAALCTTIALVLACSLPFLAPFDPARNIDFQGFILLIAGGFAWLAALLERSWFKQLGNLALLLLGIYILFCLVSLVVNPHPSYNFFGAPYIRLGAAGLIACIGIGLAARTIPAKTFAAGFYKLVCVLALVAIPYSWQHAETLTRVGGLFLQSDIFAVFMGCGLLFGVALLGWYPRFRYQLFAGQTILAILLLLSGTRSVLLLLVIIYPLWQQLVHGSWPVRAWLLYACCLAVLVFGVRIALPDRVTSTRYAAQSTGYRLDLQQAALQAGTDKPFVGYGPGNLADALDCRTLDSSELQQTCRKGYFFNSSHNIFIDRMLAVGWLGGICYLAFVVLTIMKGFRQRKQIPVEAVAALLITGYYLTNVTNVPLEVLFWILLLRVALAAKKSSRASASR